MTKKKRELIEILLDNIKPEDWPDNLPFAVYGKESCKCYATAYAPIKSGGYWILHDKPKCKLIFESTEQPKYWNKTIVHRDEFMKRWNEQNQVVDQYDGVSVSFVDAASPLSTQIGGDHYTKLAIQPMQYSMKNGLDPLQHTIIKYVTRFRDKAGIEDLEKARHCIDMLIEFDNDK